MSPELENRQEQSWGPHLTSSIIKIHYLPLSSHLGVLLQNWSCKFIHRHRLLHFDFWLLYVLHYYIFYFYFNQNLKSCAWNPIENSLKCLSDIEEKSQEIWDLVDQSFFSYKAKTEGGAYLPPPGWIGLTNHRICKWRIWGVWGELISPLHTMIGQEGALLRWFLRFGG